jgi:hypothetical protein
MFVAETVQLELVLLSIFRNLKMTVTNFHRIAGLTRPTPAIMLLDASQKLIRRPLIYRSTEFHLSAEITFDFASVHVNARWTMLSY